MAIISLLTDFGLVDGYPGIMKGVIYTISPTSRIADITHLITPQSVREGAVALFRSYRYFPSGTIHVAVVDPGVGTQRRPIALQLGEHFFVGPDNGLFTLVIQEARKNGLFTRIVETNNKKYWLPSPSNVFHGRDVFAPVAAHLSNGVDLNQLGDPIDDPEMLSFSQPAEVANGLRGEIIAIDHFGNLSTNILDTDLGGSRNYDVHIAGRVIHGLVKTFGEKSIGELVAMIGTDHDLSIAIVNGNAQAELKVAIGEVVTVSPW